MQLKRSTTEKNFSIAILLATIVLAILNINIGGSDPDTAFSINSYTFAISHPEVVDMPLYFSALIGHFVLQFLNNWGIGDILAIKLAWFICTMLIFILNYTMLKKAGLSRIVIVIAFFISMLFQKVLFPELIYNDISLFFLTIECFLIYYGLNDKCDQKRYLLFFLAGFLWAINCFVRVSNFTQIVIFLSIIICGLNCKYKVERIAKDVLITALGAATGGTLSLLIIHFIMGIPAYFKMLFSMLFDNLNPSHSLGAMFKWYFQDWIYSILCALILCLLAVIVGLINKFLNKKVLLIIGLILILGISVLLNNSMIISSIPGYDIFIDEIWCPNRAMMFFMGIYQLTSVYIIFNKRLSLNIRILYVIAFFAFYSMIVGTDTGLSFYFKCFGMQMPLTIYAVYVLANDDSLKSRILLMQNGIDVLMPLVLMFSVVVTAPKTLTWVFNNDNVANNQYTSNLEQLSDVKLPEEYCRSMEELIGYLNESNYDRLCCLSGGLELANAITGIPPALDGLNGVYFSQVPNQEQILTGLDKYKNDNVAIVIKKTDNPRWYDINNEAVVKEWCANNEFIIDYDGEYIQIWNKE